MTITIQRVAVLGAGSWGTTFAKVLADAGRDVVLWARRPEVAAAITDEPRATPTTCPVSSCPPLEATTTAAAALDGADAVVLAVPSQTLRHNLTALAVAAAAGRTLVSLAKGVELGTLERMSEVIAEVADVPSDHVAVLSGPNLAREIAAGEPTATVIACRDHDRAVALQHACTDRLLPLVHQHRRDRLRARRRGEERDRARGRDGRGHGARATTAAPR